MVLMSTECLECRESVFDLNIIADTKDMPHVIALCSNTEEQILEFREEFQPFFDVTKIKENDFYQLLGNGDIPRIILINKGDVVKAWDNGVPDIGDIQDSLNANR